MRTFSKSGLPLKNFAERRTGSEPDQNRIVPSVEKFPKSWLRFLVACRFICHWVAGCFCCHRCFRRAQLRQPLRLPQLPTVLSPTAAQAGQAADYGDQRLHSLFASSFPAAPFAIGSRAVLPFLAIGAQVRVSRKANVLVDNVASLR